MMTDVEKVPCVVIHLRVDTFCLPTRGLLLGWRLSDSQNDVVTGNPAPLDVGKRSMLLQTDTFKHRNFYTQTCCPQTPLRIKLLHQEGPCTKKLLHTELLHTDAFTDKAFTPGRPLHEETFIHRSFYTKKQL